MSTAVTARERINGWMDLFYGSIWNTIAGMVVGVGQVATFTFSSLKVFFKRPFRWHEMATHMEFVANKSVFIICLTGLFTGLALSFQVYLGFEIVNATSLVGPTVALGISRELGPVLTGMIVAARAGGAMAARLGTMRVTEQIDALEVMGVDPLQYLISPRVIAATLSMPFLCGIFIFTAMTGSYLLVVKVLNMDAALFWDKTTLWLNPSHINEGLFKSAVFGLVFSSICCYQGFNTKGGAKGVGEATNQGVVSSMVLIIVLDFFLMKLIDVYYRLSGK
jgi:phospholipid/cholesterol/gamma-HCH transport system permease protein